MTVVESLTAFRSPVVERFDCIFPIITTIIIIIIIIIITIIIIIINYYNRWATSTLYLVWNLLPLEMLTHI